MGYTTQEFTSAALPCLWPSRYKEYQIINWTPVDIVVTDTNGNQDLLPKSAQPVFEGTSCVIIESRSCNGMRIQDTSTTAASASAQMQLPAKRISIPFESIRSNPVRIEEFNCIISTTEQELIAKSMMCEINFSPVLQENRTDLEITDPRLVFQVIDPANQFDAILVNVFGQTIVLRAGRFNKVIPTKKNDATFLDRSRLICYLRYPTEYFTNSRCKQVVFDLDLNEIYKKEPFRLPSGDYICVADNMENLQEVLSKKSERASGINSGSLSDKMIPKEVYDSSLEAHKQEIDRLKEVHKNQIETLAAKHNAETAKLQAQIQNVTKERDKFESQVHQWQSLSETSSRFYSDQGKSAQEFERARKEAADNSRKDVENMWTVIKIGGTILAGVTSFALTMLVKSKK